MEKNYTQLLSECIADLKYEDIPQEVISQVKRLTLHVIGASIGAYPVDQTQKTVKITQKKGGVKEATVWGSNGEKVPAEEAAFANGTIADIMDWEDCSWTGHPSAGAIPAAFALAEAQKKSGKDYITAVVAGYEGYQRIAMAVQPSREYTVNGPGWGLISWQIFASTLAAAKIMGLSQAQISQSIGASLYQAIVPTNKHSNGIAKSDIYHYAHGFCARNGIVAVNVASEGFDNCYDALDGKDGYWHMVSDKCDWDWFTKDWGKKWLISETYLKHWPANMWVQTPLEALSLLKAQHDFAMGDIEKIRVSPFVPFIMGKYSETTCGVLDAQFNIPYCLTAYLMNPEMGAEWFTEEMRNNEKLIEFTEKIKPFGPTQVPHDNFEIFKTGSFPEVTLEIHLNDGTVHSKTMRYPKGHPRNNFTMEEQYEHFRLCTRPYMKKEQIERIIAIVDKLEELDNFDELAVLTTICLP